jgi:hypothetical protein
VGRSARSRARRSTRPGHLLEVDDDSVPPVASDDGRDGRGEGRAAVGRRQCRAREGRGEVTALSEAVVVVLNDELGACAAQVRVDEGVLRRDVDEGAIGVHQPARGGDRAHVRRLHVDGVSRVVVVRDDVSVELEGAAPMARIAAERGSGVAGHEQRVTAGVVGGDGERGHDPHRGDAAHDADGRDPHASAPTVAQDEPQRGRADQQHARGDEIGVRHDGDEQGESDDDRRTSHESTFIRRGSSQYQTLDERAVRRSSRWAAPGPDLDAFLTCGGIPMRRTKSPTSRR